MSRDFNGTSSDYLKSATAAVTAYPFTVSAWFYGDDTQASVVFALADEGTTNNYWRLGRSSGSACSFIVAAGGAEQNALTVNTGANTTWLHYCGLATSATSRNSYLSGDTANKGSNTANRTPTGLDNTTIGCYLTSTGTPQGSADGKIAEVGLWDVALTEAEIVELSLGMCPLLIRPENLSRYWPIWGNHSPEICRLSGLDLTVTGTAKDDLHPRMIYPHRHRTIYEVAAAPAGVTPLRTLMGVGV